jgi:hypothetical protein
MSHFHVKKLHHRVAGSCPIAKYTTIALTLEIDASESWQLRGIMVLVFFCI